MLALCQILALAARTDDGAALVGELLPMLPATELTGCHGLNEQQRVVGAALGLGHIGAAFIASDASAETVANLLTPVTLRLANLLRHETLAVAAAAATALGHLGGAAALPIPDGEVKPAEATKPAGGNETDAAERKAEEAKGEEGAPAPMEVEAPASPAAGTTTTTASAAALVRPDPPVPKRESPPATKVELVYAMLHLLQHSKARTAAVAALGRLMAGEVHGPFRNLILTYLFGMASTKDVDLHLSVGESLARIGAALPSSIPTSVGAASQLPPLPAVTPPKKAGVSVDGAGLAIGAAATAVIAETTAATSAASAGGGLMTYLLKKILQEYLVAWTPLVRQAACAWTLSLLKVSGNAVSVRAAAAEVQRGLVSLLADPQEATQELAAKALSMLFERCDAETQDKIVKELVGSLATTRTASAAASGGEMSTFAELSDIANNAGQPELVYKLMELSTASAVWNTRKGVAFALAGQSKERLDAHLHKLIPTLYRYTFDPNPRIVQAMKQVWSALVPEPKKALSEHLPAVLEHVMEGMIGREWRAREASCSALAEVLAGRTYAEVKEVITEIHR